MTTSPPTSVAIVGAGISGLATAYLLSKHNQYDIHVFESNTKLGGHALTVQLTSETNTIVDVDLGFQVFNLTTYPLLQTLFDELGIETEASEMSFSVFNDPIIGEWASHNLSSLFTTTSNLYSPTFLTMIKEVTRFGKEAPTVLTTSTTQTLDEYLKINNYSSTFAQSYLLPMTAAVWSVPYAQMLQFPVQSLVRFWQNHHLLDPLGPRPCWRVVSGRSQSYVQALEKHLQAKGVHLHTCTPVQAVSMYNSNTTTVHVDHTNANAPHTFDHVVLATHSNISAKLLTDNNNAAAAADCHLVSRITYQPNRVVLHSDERFMPRSKSAWASWNVLASNQSNDNVCVTYWLNRLQNLPQHVGNLFCTLNPPFEPHSIHCDLMLEHPVFSQDAIAAQQEIQQRMQENDFRRQIWYAGAWLSYGFHEDGMRSAVAVVQHLTNNNTTLPSSPWSLTRKGPKPMTLTTLQWMGWHMFQRLGHAVIKKGYLKIILSNGEECTFGRASRKHAETLHEPATELRVFDARMFWKVVTMADIGLGEAYFTQQFDTPRGQMDLMNLLQLLIVNRTDFINNVANATGILPLLYRMGERLTFGKHQSRGNTKSGSRRNIHEHYDVGNELYKLFLDESMMYSCGIYDTPTTSLHDAQLAKLDAIIAKAQLKPGMRVLEIGCGWGAFAIRAAQQTGCHVVGLTISEEQFTYAQTLVRHNTSISKLVDLRFCDYRDILNDINMPGSFDVVVSIEMLEAVGHEHFPTFFDVVTRALKPNGRAVIQVIGMPQDRYEEYCNSSDFIREFIFPGGHMPCLQAIQDALPPNVLELDVGNVRDIGPHYAQTLRQWRENFTQNKHKILDLGYSEEFWRKWIFYFVFCEVGFMNRYIFDWHLVFYRSVESTDSTDSTTTTPHHVAASVASVMNKRPTMVTGTLLVIWLLACTAVVYQYGTELLIVPQTLGVGLMLHMVLGGYKVPMTVLSGIMMATLLAFTCNMVDSITMVGMVTGLVGADVFAAVMTHGVTRPLHVWFRAVELAWLSWVCVDLVGDQGASDLVAKHFAFELVHVIYPQVISAAQYRWLVFGTFWVLMVGRIYVHVYEILVVHEIISRLFVLLAVVVDLLMGVSAGVGGGNVKDKSV